MIWLMIGMSLSMGLTAHFIGKDMDRIKRENLAKQQAEQQQQEQQQQQRAQQQQQTDPNLPSTDMSQAAADPIGQAQQTQDAIEAQQQQYDDAAAPSDSTAAPAYP
jgi:hypothetical protein